MTLADSYFQDQLLYSSLFPPYSDGKSDGSTGDSATSIATSPAQAPTKPNSATAVNVAPVEFSLLIQSSLDAFEFRARDRSRVDQDVGLLNAIDERLSVWGWETPTGTKFVIVLDAWGLPDQPEGGDGDTRYLPGMGGGGGLAWGMKEGDLKPVSCSRPVYNRQKLRSWTVTSEPQRIFAGPIFQLVAKE